MNYYVGLSLAAGSSMDSGVAVIDEDNKIILIDKLYKMNDVIFFFENFSSRKKWAPDALFRTCQNTFLPSLRIPPTILRSRSKNNHTRHMQYHNPHFPR